MEVDNPLFVIRKNGPSFQGPLATSMIVVGSVITPHEVNLLGGKRGIEEGLPVAAPTNGWRVTRPRKGSVPVLVGNAMGLY